MKTKVKTTWANGAMVSVNEKYVKQALERKEGLEIECNGAVMVVSYEGLKAKKPREVRFMDKFGRNRAYALYDFFWGMKS